MPALAEARRRVFHTSRSALPAVLVTLAFVPAGCGGGNEDDGPTTRTGPTSEADKLTAAQRRVIDVGKPAIDLLGFTKAKLSSSPNGRRVTVTVTRSEACSGDRRDEERLVGSLRRHLKTAESFKVQVAGSRESFADYFDANCDVKPIPAGSGPVVYRRKGDLGTYFSPALKIKSKRWSVEYRNKGNNFQATVFVGDVIGNEFLNTSKRGVGRKTFTGPGTFKLKIFGTGPWELRVRDGV